MVDGAAALAHVMDQFVIAGHLWPRPQLLGNEALQRFGGGDHAQILHRRQHLGDILLRAIGVE